jgi:hypothetical protein
MSYDRIFELETDDDDVVPYEHIIIAWLKELNSLSLAKRLEELKGDDEE